MAHTDDPATIVPKSNFKLVFGPQDKIAFLALRYPFRDDFEEGIRPSGVFVLKGLTPALVELLQTDLGKRQIRLLKDANCLLLCKKDPDRPGVMGDSEMNTLKTDCWAYYNFLKVCQLAPNAEPVSTELMLDNGSRRAIHSGVLKTTSMWHDTFVVLNDARLQEADTCFKGDKFLRRNTRRAAARKRPLLGLKAMHAAFDTTEGQEHVFHLVRAIEALQVSERKGPSRFETRFYAMFGNEFLPGTRPKWFLDVRHGFAHARPMVWRRFKTPPNAMLSQERLLFAACEAYRNVFSNSQHVAEYCRSPFNDLSRQRIWPVPLDLNQRQKLLQSEIDALADLS